MNDIPTLQIYKINVTINRHLDKYKQTENVLQVSKI